MLETLREQSRQYATPDDAPPLPDFSPITPQSLPGRILLGYIYRSSSLSNAEAVVWNFFLVSEAANLNPPSKIYFLDPFLYSVNEPSKIFLTKDPSG